jgi:heme/copper-type cytochrome/quinol oxidase subunit 2
MSYGPDEVFCWIRVYNEDCSDFDFGIALRYGMYYLPMFILMLLLIVLYIPVICVLSWKRNHWVGTYDPKAAAVHNMIATEIRSLVYYPIVIMLFNVIPLVKLVYSTAGNNNVASYALSLASYIVYPFQGLFMTLIFTLDPETRNKLNISSITGACMELCKPKRSIKSYPVMESSTYTDSLIKTSRSTLPVGRINSTMINDVEKD